MYNRHWWSIKSNNGYENLYFGEKNQGNILSSKSYKKILNHINRKVLSRISSTFRKRKEVFFSILITNNY